MAPPSAEEFTARFGDLSPEEQAVFVADLLSARGWQTDCDGRCIVASAGGHTRHISVGTAQQNVDEIVYVPSRIERLVSLLPGRGRRARSRRADATLVCPRDLHEQLVHAIDHEQARALYRDHFGATFDVDRDSSARKRDLPSPRVAVLAVLTVLLATGAAALLAGSVPGSGLTGQDAASTPTGAEPEADSVTGQQIDDSAATDGLTPTPHPQTEFSSETVREIDSLVQAHERVLRETPMQMRATFRGPRFLTGFDTRRSGYDPDDEASISICAESDSQYHVVQRTEFGGPDVTSVNASIERFADGAFEYRRIRRDGELEYGRQPVSDARDVSETAQNASRQLLFRYLNTTERRVTTGRNVGDPRYRLVATGRALGLDHDVRDYHATAFVRPDGFVTDLRVSYTHPGTQALVQVTVEHDTACTTAVPGWYDEARTDVRRRP
ncbi:MAG: hypothetical protein V5A39_09820 [Haloarculaceae archaeon]